MSRRDYYNNNITCLNFGRCICIYFFGSGKSTGIVTNTRITHATPSALYAHSPSRYWEDDGKVPIPSRKSCKDIARQLVEDDPGRFINVSYSINIIVIFSIYFKPINVVIIIWSHTL